MANKAAKRKVASKKRKYSRSSSSNVANEMREGHCKKRTQRKGRQGEEPKASHRYRPVQSSQEREKSPEKDVVPLICRGRSKGTMAVSFS